MPKEITHCILAERAAYTLAASSNILKKRIGGEIYFLFEENPQALYFGSIAPDLFYYDIRMPWQMRLKNSSESVSDLIHGEGGIDTIAHVFQMLSILRDARLASPLTGDKTFSRSARATLLLFTLGYLSHVAIDTLLHPIVYYFAGNYYAHDPKEKNAAQTRHRVIETILDLYNLDSLGSDLKTYHVLKKMKLEKKERQWILGFYTLALLRAFPQKMEALFKKSFSESTSVYTHPLYTAAVRSYKKQILSNRMFHSQRLARWGGSFNRRRHDALSHHSSLFYPARSYAEYTQGNRGNYFTIEDLRKCVNPTTQREIHLSQKSITQKVFARTHAFYRAAWRYAQGEINEVEARRVLKGYNLNNGLVKTPTEAMRTFSPLALNGNFEYI
ncbi:MAG TPA: zinc dependent phospholipase C family protein [Turneriella sp.]|nr:zinc dependent phospholipase C family protein [Turneriella sp.]